MVNRNRGRAGLRYRTLRPERYGFFVTANRWERLAVTEGPLRRELASLGLHRSG